MSTTPRSPVPRHWSALPNACGLVGVGQTCITQPASTTLGGNTGEWGIEGGRRALLESEFRAHNTPVVGWRPLPQSRAGSGPFSGRFSDILVTDMRHTPRAGSSNRCGRGGRGGDLLPPPPLYEATGKAPAAKKCVHGKLQCRSAQFPRRQDGRPLCHCPGGGGGQKGVNSGLAAPDFAPPYQTRGDAEYFPDPWSIRHTIDTSARAVWSAWKCVLIRGLCSAYAKAATGWKPVNRRDSCLCILRH